MSKQAMASRSKPKLTVDRGKALRFISKQEFYKMESTPQDKSNVRVLERDWYQNSTDNESYAKQICTYAVKRHLLLLDKAIESNQAANQMQLIATRAHIQQKTQICINNKILQFYQFVGLQHTAPFMFMPQQPFIVQGALPMNPSMHAAMHAMQQRRYNQLQSMQMNPINMMNKMNGMMKYPPAKRTKLSHPNALKKIEKSKEEIENEKIKKLQLPSSLINANKLNQWLDDKLKTLKEYEALVIQTCTNSKQLEQKKGAINNLRRDVDILKATVLHHDKKDTNALAQNHDLKKVYLDIIKMDKELPILRKENIKPVMEKCIQTFETCDVKDTIRAQNEIKRILSENKFDDCAQKFCNVYNKQMVSCESFESEINNVLNDDLELLRDFGVKYYVERMNSKASFNLKIVFPGCFDSEIDGEWIPPSLIIMMDERRYKHYYALFGASQQVQYVEFGFVLKEKNGIKRNRDAMENDNDVDLIAVNRGKFTQKHIEWLDQYKLNTLKRNGPFVSIVNVYNFYIDAIRAVTKRINVCDDF
eukprot:3119_1